MIVSIEYLFKHLMWYTLVMDLEGQGSEKSYLPLAGDEDLCPRVTGQAELLHWHPQMGSGVTSLGGALWMETEGPGAVCRSQGGSECKGQGLRGRSILW